MSWNKVIVSGSDAELRSLEAISITGSLSGSANSATSASFATNALTANSATSATSASFASNALTANSATSATSASFATNALTANSATSATSATSASFATNALTANSATSATSASHAGAVPFSGIYNAPALVSASAQIDLYGTTNYTSYSSSVSSQIQTLQVGDAFSTGSFTGSFTGEFFGDGSGLTGIATALDVSGSTGGATVDLQTDTLTVVGANGLVTSASSPASVPTITISGVDATTAVKGVASFSSTFFTVTGGAVSIGNNAITETQLSASVAGNGLSGGGGTALSVDYGSTANTAVQGNTNITVNGTVNQVAITGTSAQALGASPSYTIGLPNSVTINTSITSPTGSFGSATIDNDLVVSGDLIVNGESTIINTTNLTIEDRFILLNSGSVQVNDKGGLVIDEGGGVGNAFFYSAVGGIDRWGFNTAVSASSLTADQTAYAAAVVDMGVALQSSSVAQYEKPGNIRIESGEIFIWT